MVACFLTSAATAAKVVSISKVISAVVAAVGTFALTGSAIAHCVTDNVDMVQRVKHPQTAEHQ